MTDSFAIKGEQYVREVRIGDTDYMVAVRVTDRLSDQPRAEVHSANLDPSADGGDRSPAVFASHVTSSTGQLSFPANDLAIWHVIISDALAAATAWSRRGDLVEEADRGGRHWRQDEDTLLRTLWLRRDQDSILAIAQKLGRTENAIRVRLGQVFPRSAPRNIDAGVAPPAAEILTADGQPVRPEGPVEAPSSEETSGAEETSGEDQGSSAAPQPVPVGLPDDLAADGPGPDEGGSPKRGWGPFR